MLSFVEGNLIFLFFYLLVFMLCKSRFNFFDFLFHFDYLFQLLVHFVFKFVVKRLCLLIDFTVIADIFFNKIANDLF